jgi:hypothetical protein
VQKRHTIGKLLASAVAGEDRRLGSGRRPVALPKQLSLQGGGFLEIRTILEQPVQSRLELFDFRHDLRSG